MIFYGIYWLLTGCVFLTGLILDTLYPEPVTDEFGRPDGKRSIGSRAASLLVDLGLVLAGAGVIWWALQQLVELI